MCRSFTLCIIGAGLALPRANADLSPTAQSRTVGSSGSIALGTGEMANDAQSASAPDFGPFISARGVAVRLGNSTVDGIGQQNSLISPTLVTCVSLADSASFASEFDDTANGGSSAFFELTFSLTALEAWRVDAVVNDFGGIGFPNVRLETLAGDIIADLDPSKSGELELHRTVVLVPGVYVLRATATASSFAFGGDFSAGRAELDMSFARVPIPIGLIPVGADRFIVANGTISLEKGGFDSQTDGEFAVALLPFDSIAAVAVRLGEATADAAGTQNSTIDGRLVSIFGQADSFVTNGSFNDQSIANGSSAFTFDFDIFNRQHWRLDVLTNDFGGSGNTSVRLTKSTGEVLADIGGESEVHELLTLEPGHYRLEAMADASSLVVDAFDLDSGRADHNVQFRFGIIGDMNCDGLVSVSDIGGFVLALTNPAQYQANFPTCDANLADINEDTFVSVSDIGPFVLLLTGG